MVEKGTREIQNSKITGELLNCIQNVDSPANTNLRLLNASYNEAIRTIALLSRIGAVTKKEVDETVSQMKFKYSERGLRIGSGEFYDEE